MQIGDRIYVSSFLFEGMATVDYIAPPSDREFYPIQVIMDEPDENGHKVFRINQNDITDHPGEIIGDAVHYSNSDPDIEPIVEPIKRPLKKYLAEVNKPRRAYIIGERFIITEKDHTGYFHVYLTTRPDYAPIGSYLTNFFKRIEPYTGQETDIALKTQGTPSKSVCDITATNTPSNDKKAVARPKRAKKQQPDTAQMNIFEFLEGLE